MLLRIELELFHGGRGHLKPGDLILPPSVTGSRTTLDDLRGDPELEAMGRRVYRSDRVYLTSSRLAAELFALGYGARWPGWVYRAEPVGGLEPDPDCDLPGLSFQAEAATVIEVMNRRPRRGRILRELRALSRGELDPWSV